MKPGKRVRKHKRQHVMLMLGWQGYMNGNKPPKWLDEFPKRERQAYMAGWHLARKAHRKKK